MDFFSIIIPAHNSERWLGRCLDSVLEAADPECEIIIVDDGSTDDTPAIARGYADRDPRIAIVTTAHRGPHCARKAGFDESIGQYVVFVDSDDTLPSTAIADTRRLLDNHTNHVHGETAEGTAPRDCDDKPLVIIANTAHRSAAMPSLLIDGQRRALTGAEYAAEVLNHIIPGILPGHLIARELLEAIEWDADPSITNHEHSLLMLSLVMKLQQWADEGRTSPRRILLEPGVICYNFIERPGSQQCMMSLTPTGLGKIWKRLTSLGLPDYELTLWGLDLIIDSFINRGIPFDSSFSMAADLRHRAKRYRNALPDKYTEYVSALQSARKRTHISRRLTSHGDPTMLTPHASFVICSHDNPRQVRRSLKSIFNTGFRNIEIILVDCNERYGSSVELNAINIMYPRIRIAHAKPGMMPIEAYRIGLEQARGHAVMFVNAGDTVSGLGAYRAVAVVDEGADLVLVNTRHVSRFTHIPGKKRTHNLLNLKAANPNNVYPEFMAALNSDENDADSPLTVFGHLWNRNTILDLSSGIDFSSFANFDRLGTSRRLFATLINRPIRVIAAPETSPVTYIRSTHSLVSHAVSGRLSSFLI